MDIADGLTLKVALESLGRLLDAIPPRKKGVLFNDAVCLELHVKNSAALLNHIRGYFLEHGGEESPFVPLIDKLVPRQPSVAVKDPT